jgi:4-amino-4-deoxy-L-arabinose transferase-like glycosyltransferase
MIQRHAPPPTRRSDARPDPRPWLLLFGVSLALRAGFVWAVQGPDAVPYSDSAQLDALAWNLASGAGFSLNGASGPYPTAAVPPLMPWLTSLLYRVVGHSYFAGLLLQAVLGAFVPVTVLALGTALFGSPVGRLAAWGCAVHPLLVAFSGYLLTEAAFTTALMLALLASVAWVKTPRRGRALGVGLLWGLATLTRPTALPLPALVAAWAWVPLGLTVVPRERLRLLAMLGLGVAIVVLPWCSRNLAVTGVFTLKTAGAKALLDSNNPVLWSDPLRRGGAHSSFDVEPYRTLFRGRSETGVDSIARAEAWRFLDAHRAEWPAMAAAKLARFWRVTGEGGGTGLWQRGGTPLAALLGRVDPWLLWSCVTLPLAAWGLIRVARGPRRWFQSIVPALIVWFTLLAIVYWGGLRPRVPIEPLVVLLAAAGFDDARRLFRRRGSGLTVIEGRR